MLHSKDVSMAFLYLLVLMLADKNTLSTFYLNSEAISFSVLFWGTEMFVKLFRSVENTDANKKLDLIKILPFHLT